MRMLDNLSTGKEDNLRKLQSQDTRLSTVGLIIGDIRNQDEVSQAVKGMDTVVHLAAHTSVIDSLENPEEDWDINANGTLNLLEACRQNKVAKFIFATSNAVVGEQTPPIDEMKIPQPLSPYGASKLAGEALCSSYYHSFDLKTVALRFANWIHTYPLAKDNEAYAFIRGGSANATFLWENGVSLIYTRIYDGGQRGNTEYSIDNPDLVELAKNIYLLRESQ